MLQGLQPAALFTNPANHRVPKKWDSFSLTGAPSEAARRDGGGGGGTIIEIISRVEGADAAAKKKNEIEIRKKTDV